MALVIELRSHGNVLGGMEEWWDPVDLALGDQRWRFPVLSTVDPYADAVIAGQQLEQLAAEARSLAETAHESAARLLLRLADLCDRASQLDGGDLRFEGD